MSTRYDATEEDQREVGISAAVSAVRRGELVVLPTDTVYGVGADAFDPAAVTRLLEAKRRGRQMPPPVLVSSASTLDALAVRVPDWARELVTHYWPGPLTLVVHQQTSLQWDLGETRGTVAVRMPDHPLALELLTRTGPLAVSSANVSGLAAATDADAAQEMLGESVAVILDDGPTEGDRPSSIVDTTTGRPRLLRAGAIETAQLETLLQSLGTGLGLEDATGA